MAGITKLLNLLGFCVILTIAISSVKCDITILPDSLYFNITTTPRIELFTQHNQQQFALQIKSMEQQLQEFHRDYYARLEVVPHFIELIDLKLQEMDNWLNPLMLLDDVHDYCVQKYRKNLSVFATIKTNLEACKQKGILAYSSVVSAPEAALKNLRTYYMITVANSIRDCKTKNPKMDAAYNKCVTTVFYNALTTGMNSINTFQNLMKTCSCTENQKLKEIFDCYSTQVFNTFKSIGDVMGRVENCISGQEFSPICGDTNALTKGRCPYHMSWHLAEDDLKNDKVNNPFKGITKATPCLQINFITKGIAIA